MSSEEQQGPNAYQQVYDTSFKSLFQQQTVEKLNFFLAGVENARELSEKALKPSLNVDSAYLIQQNGKEKVLHIEFETDPASEMPHRMLEYYGILYRKYKKTIISLVVCPFRTTIADPPLRIIDEDKEVLVFHYRVIRLWEYKAYKMLEQHLVILYALLPTMEDANYEILSQALEEMKAYYEGQPKELSKHLLWFDTLLWRTDTVSSEDQWRVKKKMEQLDSILEQSPFVQKKKEEGREIGLEQGREQGLEQGREIGLEQGREQGLEQGREIGLEQGLEQGREQGLEQGREIGHEEGLAEGLQKALLTVVQSRFPPLVEIAQERVAQVTKPDKLDLLFKQMVTAPDEATARWVLDTLAA